MTRDELGLWMAYVEENGPLNLPLRIESAVARAVAPFLNNKSPRDLMVWPKPPEQEASIDDVFGLLKSAAKSRTN